MHQESNEMIAEAVYYARHLRLPGFDERVQERLRKARVLLVGVGGLGCPAALYLAGAGVGKITLCDADDVSATNLHRQILFDHSSIGKKKVEVAAARLQTVNPYICIETIAQLATPEMLSNLVAQYDLVLDGTDNFAAKYAINDACEAAGVPMVYGSIFQFEGQVSVFHKATPNHPRGLSYRDLFPHAPPTGLAQNCGEAGVMGVLPGIIGSMQANEAIKLITGLGEPLAGYLLSYDALSASSRKLALAKRGTIAAVATADHEIEYTALLECLQAARPPFLIDVRELAERQVVSLGGEHIPLTSLPKHLNALSLETAIVVYCKSGGRSAKAALYLRSVLPGANVWSLKGGVDACARFVEAGQGLM